MLLWNAKNVTPPPISSVLINVSSLDLVKMRAVCNRALSVLNNQKQLHVEAATLSRVLYRMKRKFRSYRAFKFMQKINRGLLHYLNMDIQGVYNTFTEMIPEKPRKRKRLYVPTRQMLQWVLVRTQGFVRLFYFVVQTCQEAAKHWQEGLTMGHMWLMSLLGLGLTSRIWAISKYLIICACEWYSELKPFLTKLKIRGRRPWLPADYVFPKDLIQWLDASWLLEKPKSMKPASSLEKVFARVGVPDDDEVQFTGEVIDLGSETDDPVVNEENLLNGPVMPLVQKQEDIGEIVSRDALRKKKPLGPTQPPKKKKGSPSRWKKKIRAIKTHKKLQKFLRVDLNLYEVGSENSIVHKLDRLQWHMFRKAMESYKSQLDSNKDVIPKDKPHLSEAKKLMEAWLL